MNQGSEIMVPNFFRIIFKKNCQGPENLFCLAGGSGCIQRKIMKKQSILKKNIFGVHLFNLQGPNFDHGPYLFGPFYGI